MTDLAEEIRRRLQLISEEMPAPRDPPGSLVRRARRGAVVTIVIAALAVSAAGTGVAAGVIAALHSRAVSPAGPVQPVPASSRGRIAFISLGEQSPALEVVSAGGTGRRRILSVPGLGGGFARPAWSPEGTQIALTRVEGGEPPVSSEIDVVNVDGTGLVPLVTSKEMSERFWDGQELVLGSVDWSPDGTKVAFGTDPEAGDGRIYVVNKDGTGLALLSAPHGLSLRDPAWSPDGAMLAVTGTDLRGPQPATAIYVMNADGSGLRKVIDAEPDSRAAWSPDGTTIAFSGRVGGPERDVFVVKVDGTGLTDLTNTPGSSEDDPTWSPDGTWIAFGQSTAGMSTDIYVMKANGTDARPVTGGSAPAHEIAPEWEPPAP
jgi:Tol biopolymer transport system component